jgi:hypothetical protein
MMADEYVTKMTVMMILEVSVIATMVNVFFFFSCVFLFVFVFSMRDS